ncbi:MAG: hypothetical protein IJP46_03690 [Prevotella sp.]|nr:hypothetical protein [Prevotella sp.]
MIKKHAEEQGKTLAKWLDFPCFLTSLPHLITLLAKNFANFNKEEFANLE